MGRESIQLANLILEVSIEGFKRNIREIAFHIHDTTVAVFPDSLDHWTRLGGRLHELANACNILSKPPSLQEFRAYFDEYPVCQVNIYMGTPGQAVIQ
ncbi:hypothetical protein IWQ61_009241, partial [Dispira simplex]